MSGQKKQKFSFYQTVGPVVDAVKKAGSSVANFLTPFKQRSVTGGITLPGRSVITGAGSQYGIPNEIAETNPTYINPTYIQMIRNFSVVRIGLVRMRAAIQARKFTLSGGTSEARKFHQSWINRILPDIDSMVPEAMFYGCFFAAVDWDMDDKGRLHPTRLKTTEVLTTTILTDENNDFIGFRSDGQEMLGGRAFYMAWEAFANSLYGFGQVHSAYIYWFAYCFTLTWKNRYLEAGVDPMTILHVQKIAIKTGRLNSDGSPESIPLTRILRDAFASATGGARITLPKNDDGDNMAEIETVEMPDRGKIYDDALGYLKQSLLETLYAIPGAGITSTVGDNTAADAAISEKTQTSFYDLFAAMPQKPINELIAISHKLSGLDGPAPTASPTTLDPLAKELFSNIMKSTLTEELKDFETGAKYQLKDTLDFSQISSVVGLPKDPDFTPGFVSDPAPGKGGRPREPYGDRSEARQKGQDR